MSSSKAYPQRSLHSVDQSLNYAQALGWPICSLFILALVACSGGGDESNPTEPLQPSSTVPISPAGSSSGSQPTPKPTQLKSIPEINSFVVVDTNQKKDIATFTQQGKISKSTFPRINVRADATNTKSVIFTLPNGEKAIQNSEPFSLMGDSGGVYSHWSPEPGTYKIQAQPFSELNGEGDPGPVTTFNLEITSSTPPNPGPAQAAATSLAIQAASSAMSEASKASLAASNAATNASTAEAPTTSAASAAAAAGTAETESGKASAAKLAADGFSNKAQIEAVKAGNSGAALQAKNDAIAAASAAATHASNAKQSALRARMASNSKQPPPQTLACANSSNYYTSHVDTLILGNNCSGCHAGSVFKISGAPGDIQSRMNNINNYILPEGGALKFLNKISGVGHSEIFKKGSSNYNTIASYLNYQNECSPSIVKTESQEAKVERQGALSTLKRAAVLFSGRYPTAEEIRNISAAGAKNGEDNALRSQILKYMNGPAFDVFLNDVGDLHFLTQRINPLDDNRGLSADDFEKLNELKFVDMEPGKERAAKSAGKNKLSYFIKREPVELLKYIVRNDISYKEIITADYTVVNPFACEMLKANLIDHVGNCNSFSEHEFKKAKLPQKRRGEGDGDGWREHAGVLSTHAWLASFPTSSGNRNRTRIHYLLKQFMATEMFDLATLVPNINSGKNPTVKNPKCASCHAIMDPMAAGFQNFDESNRWRPQKLSFADYNGFTALPQEVYFDIGENNIEGEKSAYINGDNWYRDNWLPGYAVGIDTNTFDSKLDTRVDPKKKRFYYENPITENPHPMEGGYKGNKSALQLLAKELVKSPKFSLGAVHFWYKGITGLEPLKPNADDYFKNQAYLMQSTEFKKIAEKFSSTHNYKVKELLADLMMSDWLILNKQEPTKQIDWSNVGHFTMLTPSQLNQKLQNTVGMTVGAFLNPYSEDAVSWAGGYDASGVTDWQKEYTKERHGIINHIMFANRCKITSNGFLKDPDNPPLFPEVNIQTDDDAAIMRNIIHLHKELWGETVQSNSTEVIRTYDLFRKVQAQSVNRGLKAKDCQYNDQNDPKFIARAWSFVLAYMLADYKFLFVNND